jgi:DNA-binding CsgD family transcriptional regulator
MNAQTLSQIIPAAGGRDQDEMLRLIHALESIEDLFVGFMLGHDNNTRFVYMSPSLEIVTGYPVSNLTSDTGFEFLYTITPLEYRAHIVERAAFYAWQTKQADFSVLEPQLMQIDGGLLHKNGNAFRVRFLSIVLEYASNRDLVLSLCTWQNVEGLGEAKLNAIKESVHKKLIHFKDVYMRVYPDKFKPKAYLREEAVKVVYPLYKGPAVTKKEYEVLQLISNGYSSKKIAEHLHISFHTAESHRKNLLEKFEAVNTAELMKKASKVFWFE